jgi:hypothetical protein
LGRKVTCSWVEKSPVLGSVAGEVRGQTGLVPAHVFELLVLFAEPARRVDLIEIKKKLKALLSLYLI